MTRLFAGTPWDIPPRCDHCGKDESECQCSAAIKSRLAPEKQTARVRVEKRKKGKTVTVVYGLTAAANDLPRLLKDLKAKCGAGGCVEGDTLEIQGEHETRLTDWLRQSGFRVQK